jgi:Carboxypeptidase regulatory-like domain
MQKSFLKSLFLAVVTALALALSPLAHAQGVVSSGITGTISDTTGKPIGGATVTVVHVPTNTTYTAITGSNGRFKVSGLRVGGPYTVSATSGSSTISPLADVDTGLGEDTDVSLVASSDVMQLEKFVATGARNDLDANATGAGSVLSNRRISMQPTSTRSFADMMKTNPFVTVRSFPQVTALGMNNRYNSITLDGARVNDQFGLSPSGLFSLKNPFSLDAVENFSISLVPYDVTQSGFAGASINVVSKSGTNEFHGSAYYLYTSDQWQGKDLSGTNAGKRPAAFYERTWGATLGGPIIKNKLFFFLNYEKFSNPSLGPSSAGFKPDTAALAVIDNAIKALPGSPNLGSFGAAGANLLQDTKKLAKLDWNITKDHRLSVRYSRTEGTQPSYPSFNTTGFSSSVTIPGAGNTGYNNGITSYDSNYYNLAVLEKVWAAQLYDNWSPEFKTQFAFSKNDTTSLRSTPVLFPEIRILNVPGLSSTGAPINTLDALAIGTDVSSMGNGVVSNSLSYNGNAEYSWRDLTFKGGFDREETDFENLFRNGSYGVFAYNYSPTLNLATAQPIGFARGVASEGFPGTDLSRLEQTGYFVQAKWEPIQRFNMTFGLRYDVLGSPIAPTFNPAFSSAFGGLYPGIRNDGTIDGTSRAAPRVSFNYALDRDRKIQVRGGLGVFLGRNPWVWISNSYGNAGFGRFTVTRPSASSPTLGQYLGGGFAESDLAFKFDPAAPLGTTKLPATAGTPSVNFIEPGLKLPTNLRGNVAVDFKLPKLDATFTVEYIHTDVMEAMFYDNLNLKVLNSDSTNKPTSSSYGADGRLRFASNAAGTAGGTANAPLVVGWGNILRLSNVDVGSSDYVAFAFDRPMKNGWAYNVAYTRGHATEAQPAGSSTAGSQWSFNVVFNQGAIEKTRSDYEIKDRVQASFTKEFTYFKRAKTSVTLAYEGRSGQPISYVYSGDLNRDGNSANDVFAVPTGASDARFNFSSMTTAQQDAYFAFINSSGLSKYAGGYAPRNSFIGAWQNRLDLHVSQEVKLLGSTQFEVFADFINFGNWISKDLFNYVETLNASSANSNQNRVLGNATYGADGRIIPTVVLNADNSINIPANSQFLPNNSDARWRIVAGARFKF